MLMRIVSANLNGLRSATNKGFIPWIQQSGADIVCVQETKAQEHQLGLDHRPSDWHSYFFDAERPGYSGTGIYSRLKPDLIRRGLGFPLCDSEGRWLEAHFGELIVVSLYLPSGSSGPEAQARKDTFLELLLPELKARALAGQQLIICGDWNMAHHPIDLKNWRGNQKNSGFLPHERAWLTQLFDEVGMIDAFRQVDIRPEQYTWWSNRGQAYANNVGWRIDYQITSANLRARIKSASIYKEQRFSDHAPLIMDYDL